MNADSSHKLREEIERLEGEIKMIGNAISTKEASSRLAASIIDKYEVDPLVSGSTKATNPYLAPPPGTGNIRCPPC